MLALSEITLALTAMLRPAWNTSAPAVPLAAVTIELLIARSLFACNVTDVPAFVNAVMVDGAMVLSVPGVVANVSGFGEIVPAPELSIVMFCGSSSSMPAAP